MRNTLAVIAVAVLAVSPLAGQPPVEAKFVTPQFVAALVLEPARLDESAKSVGLPVGELWKTIEGISGTATKQFERVTVLVDPFPGGNVAFMPAFVLRFPAGVDARKQLTPLLGGEVKEFKVGDITYVRSTRLKLAMVEMAGYAIDDRTLLVAAWPHLEPMLKPGGEKDKNRALAAELGKADFAHDAVVIVTPGSFLKKFLELQKQAGMPYFKEVKSVMERTEAITIALDLGKKTVIRTEFRCDNAEGAGVVLDTLKDLLGKAKDGYPAVRKDLEKQFPSERTKLALPLFDEAVNDHKLTKEGNTIVLTVARPKDWKK